MQVNETKNEHWTHNFYIVERTKNVLIYDGENCDKIKLVEHACK